MDNSVTSNLILFIAIVLIVFVIIRLAIAFFAWLISKGTILLVLVAGVILCGIGENSEIGVFLVILSAILAVVHLVVWSLGEVTGLNQKMKLQEAEQIEYEEEQRKPEKVSWETEEEEEEEEPEYFKVVPLYDPTCSRRIGEVRIVFKRGHALYDRIDSVKTFTRHDFRIVPSNIEYDGRFYLPEWLYDSNFQESLYK